MQHICLVSAKRHGGGLECGTVVEGECVAVVSDLNSRADGSALPLLEIPKNVRRIRFYADVGY